MTKIYSVSANFNQQFDAYARKCTIFGMSATCLILAISDRNMVQLFDVARGRDYIVDR
jgi:hypothetical protein